MRVIAEVGSNFKTYEDCINSVKAAHLAGADTVKFQMYTHRELYGVAGRLPGELPRDWVPYLRNYAEHLGIEFMCTAFSPEGYEFVNSFVSTHKIASAELGAPDILKKVNSLGKPVVLSTAGSTLDEIAAALELLKDVKVTIMFCVADYPAKIIDFRNLKELSERFGKSYQYGFSDHSTDVLNIPHSAKFYGATVIEKHVNFTRYTDTPDAGHSLNAQELSLMITNLKKQVPRELVESLCNQSMKKDWKRRHIKLQNGESGYFRPLPE